MTYQDFVYIQGLKIAVESILGCQNFFPDFFPDFRNVFGQILFWAIVVNSKKSGVILEVSPNQRGPPFL